MSPVDDIPDAAVSAANEYEAREAIRDLLEEHKGSMTAVQLKLSVWLDEEFIARFHKELKDLPMSTLDPRIEKLRVEYGLERTDFWELPQKKGTWLVKHSALETVAAKASITFDMPEIVEARSADKIAVVVVRAFMGDRSIWSFGEASPANSKNSYPFAMAEKRAIDRCILKLAGLHGLIYSEDEIADDTPAPKSSASLKRDSSWSQFQPELAEVSNEVQLQNFLAAWRKISIDEGWNMALKETARDLIEGKRAELAKPIEDDDTFPPDRGQKNAYLDAMKGG